MTTGFTSFDSSEKFNTSRVKLLDNDKNALTWNADTAFPTNGVANGMPCFRTDENKLYVRVSGAWSDFVGFGDALTFNKAVTINGNLEVNGKIKGISVNKYAECSTAAATAEKTVDCEGFTLDDNVTVTIKFTVNNTAANPTLNVSGTGAYPIYYRGTAVSAGYLGGSRIVQFVFHDSKWQIVGDFDINDRVKQVVATDNNEYTVLGSYSANLSANSTSYVKFSSGIKMNPSTNTLTFSRFKTTVNCGTWVSSAQGNCAVSPSNSAGAYSPLWNYNSTNGTFVIAGYQNYVHLVYLVKANVDAGTNNCTKTVRLMDESGNAQWPGTITAPNFNGLASKATADNLGNVISNTYVATVGQTFPEESQAQARTNISAQKQIKVKVW